MSRSIRKRPRAEQELLEHFVYLGDRNPKAADRFIDAVEKALTLLAQFPKMGKAWPYELPHLAGVRSWIVPRFKNYRIFYRPIDDGIELLRVIHARRDLSTLLDEEEPEEPE